MVFDVFEYPMMLSEVRWLSEASAWVEHIPFGFALMEMMRPRVVVELGTHSGVSYCALCQAIADLGIEAKSYAVDLWRGDAHTGPYDENIYLDLKKYHDSHYGKFSTLMRTDF